MLVTLISIPSTSSALSCMSPEGMTDYYVKEEGYTIVTAKALERKEFVREKADTKQGFMYDSGYTGQFIEVSKAHKGASPDRQWVYYEVNNTWKYLCVGEPVAVGEESVFVIRQSGELLSLPMVVAVYEVDSDLAKDLLEALEDAKISNDAEVYEVRKQDWIDRLKTEVADMAFLLKVRFEEWKYWLAKVT